MGLEKKRLGKAGEDIAVKFLKKKGYKILNVNARTPFGELDAVARIKDFIIFIEIKTRATSSLGPPYLSVTKEKQRRIVKNALFYLKWYGLANSFWRVDVVSVMLNYDDSVKSIELIENAVQEEYLK